MQSISAELKQHNHGIKVLQHFSLELWPGYLPGVIRSTPSSWRTQSGTYETTTASRLSHSTILWLIGKTRRQ
jgi:hypothetical protein